jgi:uncharacterized protein YcbX
MLYEVRPGSGELKKIQLDSHPKCALFEQRIVSGPQEKDAVVVVRYLGLRERDASEDDDSLSLPLEPDLSSLEKIDVNLHGSPASAYRMGDTCDAWFSDRFGVPTVLVYLGDGRRAVLGKTLLPKTAPEQQQQKQGGWMTSLTSYITGPQQPDDSAAPWLTFTDVAPLLVTSEASLRDVSGRLLDGQTVGMYKFRPNVVVDGEGQDAWAEDFWAELEIEAETETEHREKARKQTLQLTGNCVRCTSLNVDYQTGKPAEGEQGNVLKRLMKDRRVDPGTKWSPVFGRYAFPDSRSESFTVSVGDGVEVTRHNVERSVWDWPGL